MWTKSIPDDVCKLDYPLKSQNERAECLIGMMKISRNIGSPGCKLHLISQRDGKLNAYINKTVVWISAQKLPGWYDEFLAFMMKQR
jgi:hypothetical protein